MRTGNKPQAPRCSLASMIQEPINVDAIKGEGWRKQRILVVSLDDPRLDMIGREFVKQIGRKLYGQETMSSRNELPG